MEVYDEIKGFADQTRVLFTSGYTKDVVIDKGIKEGESDFISKPLTAEELLRKVRSILDGKTGNP
jgi:two-component system, cell cycle sensor histidine kinase and response regulator CckA